jgi:hypothetical protein
MRQNYRLKKPEVVDSVIIGQSVAMAGLVQIKNCAIASRRLLISISECSIQSSVAGKTDPVSVVPE